MDNSELLLLNIVLWILTLIWYLKKYKHFGAGGLLISAFLFYAVCSYPIFFDTVWNGKFKDLELFPLIVHYLLIMMTFLPILKWDKIKAVEIRTNNLRFIKYVCWFWVICSFLSIGDLTDLYTGIFKLLSPGEGMNVYQETMANSQFGRGDQSISNIFGIFVNLLYGICTLFFFYLLYIKDKNKFLIIGMFVAMLISILNSIAISQRGPALNRVLLIIGTYFIFKAYLSNELNKKIKKVFIIIGLLLTIPIGYITFSRFDDRGVINSLCYYFGEQNIYFNNYAFDNNGIRYGDRIVPVFKQMLGFENVPVDFWERRMKYPHLYINDEVFIGYIGDFFLDFGSFFAPIILLLITSCVYKSVKLSNGYIDLRQLLPITFVMHVCLFGGLFLFPYADGGNLIIIMYILMFFALKLIK